MSLAWLLRKWSFFAWRKFQHNFFKKMMKMEIFFTYGFLMKRQRFSVKIGFSQTFPFHAKAIFNHKNVSTEKISSSSNLWQVALQNYLLYIQNSIFHLFPEFMLLFIGFRKAGFPFIRRIRIWLKQPFVSFACNHFCSLLLPLFFRLGICVSPLCAETTPMWCLKDFNFQEYFICTHLAWQNTTPCSSTVF